MLLSGIYYGKTPIARAYKGKDIIWSLGTNKYLDDFSLDIKLNTAAYITSGAMEYIKLEKNITVSNIADIQYGDTGELCISAGIYSFIISPEIALGDSQSIFPVLGVRTQSGSIESSDKSALVLSNHNISIDGDVDISDSPSVIYETDGRIEQSNDAFTDMGLSRIGACNDILRMLTDTIASAAKSSVGTIENTITGDTYGDIHTVPTEAGAIEESIEISNDACASVLRAKKHFADDKTVINIDADISDSSSITGNINEHSDIFIDAELSGPTSSSGSALEEFDINAYALLNNSSSKNGAIDNDVVVDDNVAMNVEKSETASIAENVVVPIDASLSSNKTEISQSDIAIESEMDAEVSVNRSSVAEMCREIIAYEHALIGVSDSESGNITTGLSVGNSVFESVTPSDASEINYTTSVRHSTSMHSAESKRHYFDNDVLVDTETMMSSSTSSSGCLDSVVSEDEQASLNCIVAQTVNGNEDVVVSNDAFVSNDKSSALYGVSNMAVEFNTIEEVSPSKSVDMHDDVEFDISADMDASDTSNGFVINDMRIYGNVKEEASRSSGVFADEVSGVKISVKYYSQPTEGGEIDTVLSTSTYVFGADSLSESIETDNHIFVNDKVQIGLPNDVNAMMNEPLCATEDVNLNNSNAENIAINNEVSEFDFNSSFDIAQEVCAAFDTGVSPIADVNIDTPGGSKIQSYDCYILFGNNIDASMPNEQVFATDDICTFFGYDGKFTVGNENVYIGDYQISSGESADIKCGDIYQFKSDKLIFLLQSGASICNGDTLIFQLNDLSLTHSDSDLKITLPTALDINHHIQSDSGAFFIQFEPTSSTAVTQIMSGSSNNIILLVPPYALVDERICSNQNVLIENKDSDALYVDDFIKINCENILFANVSKNIYWKTNIENIYIANLTNSLDSKTLTFDNMGLLLEEARLNISKLKTTGQLEETGVITNEHILGMSTYNHIAENTVFEANCEIGSRAVLSFSTGMWEYPIWRDDDLLITQINSHDEYLDGIIIY